MEKRRLAESTRNMSNFCTRIVLCCSFHSVTEFDSCYGGELRMANSYLAEVARSQEFRVLVVRIRLGECQKKYGVQVLWFTAYATLVYRILAILHC